MTCILVGGLDSKFATARVIGGFCCPMLNKLNHATDLFYIKKLTAEKLSSEFST